MAEEKRILAVTHQLSRTGAPLVLFDAIKILIEEGYIVNVLAMSDGPLKEDLEDCGIMVTFGDNILKDYTVWIEIFKMYDLVICNTLVSLEAVHVLSLTDIPTLWWIHEPQNYFELLKDVLPDIKNLKSNIKMIAASPVIRDIIASRYQVEVPLVMPFVEDVTIESERDKSDKAVFVCAGVYSSMKGQDLLMAAVKQLPNQMLDKCKFEFYGAKAQADEGILEQLNKAKKEGYPIMVGDALSRSDMLETIKKAHYLIAPSRTDTLSMVAVEAMMLSTVPIISKHCGVTKAISDESYIGIDPYDVTAFANVIEDAVRMREDKSKYREYAEAARIQYETYFTKDIFKQQFLTWAKHALSLS